MRRLRAISASLFVVSILLFGICIIKDKVIDDKTGPLFHMDSNTVEVSVKDEEKELLRGLTAVDASDGDVTDSIIVESISPFTGTGHRIVTYAAFDSDNHVTHVKRELEYTDYEPTRFHLNKQLSFAMNATNLLDGITGEDCIDGDITKSIRMMSDQEINTSYVGEYNARLKVTNSAGGVSYLPVTVEIFDAAVHYRLPQIKLTENVVYVKEGEFFEEEDYLKSIVINGAEYSLTHENESYASSNGLLDMKEKSIDFDRVDIESDVDTDVTGYYEVVYSFEDTEFSTGTGKTRLYVVVTERENS